MLDYKLQLFEACRLMKLNDEEFHQIFVNEMYSSPPKMNYLTNKTKIKSFDDTWSSDLLDLIDFGPSSNRCFRYILVVTDSYSNYELCFLMEIKHSKAITDEIIKQRVANSISLRQTLERNTLTKVSTTSWNRMIIKDILPIFQEQQFLPNQLKEQ